MSMFHLELSPKKKYLSQFWDQATMEIRKKSGAYFRFFLVHRNGGGGRKVKTWNFKKKFLKPPYKYVCTIVWNSFLVHEL